MKKILLCFSAILLSCVCIAQMNYDIQTTFFGTTFGDSKGKVLRCLRRQGFYANMPDRNTVFAINYTIAQSYINFGGRNWLSVSCNINDANQFYKISFFGIKHFSKSDVEKEMKSLIHDLSQKYGEYRIIDDCYVYNNMFTKRMILIYIVGLNNDKGIKEHYVILTYTDLNLMTDSDYIDEL